MASPKYVYMPFSEGSLLPQVPQSLLQVPPRLRLRMLAALLGAANRGGSLGVDRAVAIRALPDPPRGHGGVLG